MALYMDHTLNIGITLAILRLSTGNIPVVMVGLLKGCNISSFLLCFNIMILNFSSPELFSHFKL